MDICSNKKIRIVLYGFEEVFMKREAELRVFTSHTGSF